MKKLTGLMYKFYFWELHIILSTRPHEKKMTRNWCAIKMYINRCDNPYNDN